MTQPSDKTLVTATVLTMPGPSVSPPPLPPPLPPLPPPDITSAAEQRFAATRYVVIDEAVPKELLSLIHSFISQHKLSPSPHLCGHSFLVFSHNATAEQLLALHRRVASLAAVTLLPSSLFLSTPSLPSSPPAPSPPTRPVILSFLSLYAQCRVSCSSLSADEKALLSHLTTSLSGYYGKAFDHTYTHLITNSSRSDKYAACQQMTSNSGCIAVLPAYLTRCYKSATLHTPTPDDSQRLLTGLRLCVTGIEAAERNAIMRLIQAEGGEYSANLTKACTHLIAQKAEGPKYMAAETWKLKIVSKAWLLTAVKERRVVDEADWPVGRLMDEEKEEEAGQDGEERKEAVEMEVDADDSKQPAVINGNSRVNGHRRPVENNDDEEEKKESVGENRYRQQQQQQQQQQRHDEEKHREEDECKESALSTVHSTTTTAVVHQNGIDAAGWKKKLKKAATTANREHKPAEEDDSLKTIPLPDERTQSPRPHSPAAPLPAPQPPATAARVASPSAAAEDGGGGGGGGGDDSYLDGVQVLLCVPMSSPLFLRCVALIRAGGGTRLSSYRPTVTNIVSTDVALVQSMLRADRLSLLPASTITTATPSTFASTLPTPIVSTHWLEASTTAKQPLPIAHYLVPAVDEPLAPAPAAPSRQSSVVRQRVVSEFAAFNDSIVRDKGGAAGGGVVQKKRRRTRSSAKGGMFAGKLFAFEGLELTEQEELLLSIRKEGGDVLAADETEDDVHIVVARYWTSDLPTKYPHATFVTPTYITDRLTNPTTKPSTPYTTLSHTPLPQHTDSSHTIPAFAHYTFALTGYNQSQQQELKRLLTHLGARPTTDGMSERNTHLLCREGSGGGDAPGGRKWELAWGGGWKGRVVRLRWLVECVRQGREVPLTEEMVWRNEDGEAERQQDEQERAEGWDGAGSAGPDKRAVEAGKRAVVPVTNGVASASPIIDVDMQVEAKQPPPSAQLQNGRAADEEDVDKTEQDSTAEHMDIELHHPTPTHHTSATHNSADEQADILAPLPPPSPTSSHSSPFPTRYGRQQQQPQQQQRTNRIYTPPKTPNSAATPPSSTGVSRGRRRKLAVEDGGGPVEGGGGGGKDDVFGFQGADDGGKDEQKKKKKEEKGSGKAAVAANVKEKAEVQRKRIQEEEEEAYERSQEQLRKSATKETGEVIVRAKEAEPSKAGRVAAVNGERDAKKQLEHELEQLEEDGAEVEEEQQERSGERRQNGRAHKDGDEVDAKTEATSSRLPGRKRLNTAQRKEEDEEEEEEAEYVPPPTQKAAEEEKKAEQPPPSERKRSSKTAAKVPKAAPPAKPELPVEEEQKAQPAPTGKGRTRAKRSVTPPSTSTSGDEEKEEREEVEEKKPASSANGRPSSAGKKSARAQRKEQLKAKDAVSPVKAARPSRRPAAAAPLDDEADSVPDSGRPVRSTRKRSAPPQPADDVIAVDSDESSSNSSNATATAKRARLSEAAADGATAAETDFKYRFAIASKGSMSAEKAASLREMIEALGAECIDDGDDYSLCSAVVIKDSTQLKRTEKVLAAIVAGLPIVPRSYIEASSAKGEFLLPLPSSYRFKKDDLDDTGRVLMRAAARWKKKRPFKGWAVSIHDTKRHRMLTTIIGMGEGRMEDEDVSECTHCLVDVKEGGVEGVMKRMWNAGVPVYRSELVVEYICYSEQKEWPDWDMDAFKLTKDNWKTAWTNPWKLADSVAGSQSTHGTEGVEVEGKKKRRS